MLGSCRRTATRTDGRRPDKAWALPISARWQDGFSTSGAGWARPARLEALMDESIFFLSRQGHRITMTKWERAPIPAMGIPSRRIWVASGHCVGVSSMTSTPLSRPRGAIVAVADGLGTATERRRRQGGSEYAYTARAHAPLPDLVKHAEVAQNTRCGQASRPSSWNPDAAGAGNVADRCSTRMRRVGMRASLTHRRRLYRIGSTLAADQRSNRATPRSCCDGRRGFEGGQAR